MAIRIGSTLFAIEIKYDHFPAEAHEIYHFVNDARKATAQIARKVRFLEDNLTTLKKKGLIGNKVESVIGLVLNSTMLLSGLPLNDVPFIDQIILEEYLSNVSKSTIRTNEAIFVIQERPFYSSRGEFEAGAKVYFSDPPQPRQFKEKLSKIKFSRGGGQNWLKGYDLEVYDLATGMNS